MKNKIFEFLYKLANCFFKIINFNKPKIFVYSDSRGFDVCGKFGKNPFKSYLKPLIFKFNTTYFICKEKHTTISDFLVMVKDYNIERFDFVILHCGVVDFSPRPISNLEWILNSKEGNTYFDIAKSMYEDYYKYPDNVFYQNERTLNLYSPEFLRNCIIPDLLKLKKLIWISSNHFVKGWEGNYVNGRPKNIDKRVYFFESIMLKNLHNTIDLWGWKDRDVKDNTIDNIHFSKKGFKIIGQLILEKLSNE